MPLSAVLFDVDGTLADTEPQGHLPAYNAAFAELGLAWHWSRQLYSSLLHVPGGHERIAYYMDAYNADPGPHAGAVATDRAAWIDALHARKSAHLSKLLSNGCVPLRSGIARLFEELVSAGIAIGVVTNASRGTLRPVVEYLLGERLASWVGVFVCGDEVAHKKPEPDPYLAACERLQVAPVECVAIEDSETGLTSARRAGIATLITVNDDTRGNTFAGACAVVDGLGEPDEPATTLVSPGFELGCITLDSLRRLVGGS